MVATFRLVRHVLEKLRSLRLIVEDHVLELDAAPRETHSRHPTEKMVERIDIRDDVPALQLPLPGLCRKVVDPVVEFVVIADDGFVDDLVERAETDHGIFARLDVDQPHLSRTGRYATRHLVEEAVVQILEEAFADRLVLRRPDGRPNDLRAEVAQRVLQRRAFELPPAVDEQRLRQTPPVPHSLDVRKELGHVVLVAIDALERRQHRIQARRLEGEKVAEDHARGDVDGDRERRAAERKEILVVEHNQGVDPCGP